MAVSGPQVAADAAWVVSSSGHGERPVVDDAQEQFRSSPEDCLPFRTTASCRTRKRTHTVPLPGRF